MKRFLLTLIVALSVVLPASALASNVTLSPTAVSVTPGKVFTINVTANPVGEKVYTVRANVSFNPKLVHVTSFTFAPKWLALSTSGYDLTDNTNGLIIKTAGYPGGISSPMLFGTITFTAVASGTANISVTGNSLVLDENSKNTISGTQGVAVVAVSSPHKVVKKAPKKVVHKTYTKKTVKKTVPVATVVAVEATSTATSTAMASGTVTQMPLQAAASAPIQGSTPFTTTFWAIVALVIVLGIVLWTNRKRLFR